MANNLNFGGIYDHIEFPPYVFREYPKMLTRDGKTYVVNSTAEEVALISRVPEDAKSNPVVEERNQLATQVADLRAEAADKDAQLAALREQLAKYSTPSSSPSSGSKAKA